RALLEGESKQWIIWREEHAGKLPQDIINTSYNYTDIYSTYQERNRNKASPAARITDTRHRMPVTNMSSSAHYSARSTQAGSHTTMGGRTGRDLLSSTYRPSTTVTKDERIVTDLKELRTFTPDYSSWRSTEMQQKRIPERRKTEVTTSSTVSFSKESAHAERSDKDHKPDAENTRTKPGFTRFPAYELITNAKPSKYEETIIETRTTLKDKRGGSQPTDEKTSLPKEKDKLEKQTKDEKKKTDEKSLREESVDFGRKTEQKKYIHEEFSQKVTGSDISTARTLKSESTKKDATVTSESRSKDVIEVPISIERPAPDQGPQRNKEVRVQGVKTSIGRETDDHVTKSAESLSRQVRISEVESSLEGQEQIRDGSHKMGTLPTENIAENIVSDILKSFTQSSRSQMSTDTKVTYFDKKEQEDEGKIKTEFTVQSQVQENIDISDEGD
ncbi:SYNEM protein, partial [Spelaeornis formosus]|nr:SYNEM protein [Elachura formosa]